MDMEAIREWKLVWRMQRNQWVAREKGGKRRQIALGTDNEEHEVQESLTHTRSLPQGAGGRRDRWHPAGGIINRHKLLWKTRLGNWVRFF